MYYVIGPGAPLNKYWTNTKQGADRNMHFLHDKLPDRNFAERRFPFIAELQQEYLGCMSDVI